MGVYGGLGESYGALWGLGRDWGEVYGVLWGLSGAGRVLWGSMGSYGV